MEAPQGQDWRGWPGLTRSARARPVASSVGARPSLVGLPDRPLSDPAAYAKNGGPAKKKRPLTRFYLGVAGGETGPVDAYLSVLDNP